MKAFKITLLIIDHDEIRDVDEIADIIENQKYPNRCISPRVMHTHEADIGEWSDDHPLNHSETFDAEYARLFPTD